MMSLILMEIVCFVCKFRVEAEETVDDRKYLMEYEVNPKK
jgi:hypothetical protein